MHPVLFKIDGLTIHTYGFFVAVGILAGIFCARKEAARLGMDPDKIVDLCFYIVIAAIVGSRLLYVFTDLDFFFAAPLEMFKLWKGGLVFYGGFIGAVLVAVFFIYVYHLPLGKCADIAALAIPLGHSLGRLGCFSAGCCYGKICDLPWAVTFHHPLSLAPLHVPIHPTQLYSFAANLLIFLSLFFYRTRKKYDGQLFWLYVFFYGISRSVIEVYRGDFRGVLFFDTLSMSQMMGVGFAVLAAVILIILSGRSAFKKKDA